MADGSGNIIEVVFRAVVDKLKAGLDQAQSSVARTTDGIKNSMASASASVSSSSDNITRSMERATNAASKAGSSFRNTAKEMGDFKLLEKIIDGTVESMEELAAADAAVERLHKQNLLTTVEYNAALSAQIALTERLELEQAKEAAARKVVNNEKAKGLVLDATAQRQLASISVQAATGQWQGMTSVMASFVTTSGIMTGVIGAIVASMSALVAALSLVALGFVGGQKETDKFNHAIATSGNVAGTSAGQMHELAAAHAYGAITIGDASNAVTKLVASGRVHADTLQTATQLAANFARITGSSMEEAANKVAALGDDPMRAVQDLDGAMNLLTLEQYEFIRSLEATEGKFAAADAAYKLLADASGPRAEKMVQDASYVARAWQAVVGVFSQAKDGWMSLGREKSHVEKMNELYAELERAQKGYGGASSEFNQKAVADIQRRIQAELDSYVASEKAAAAEAKRAQSARIAKEASDYIQREHLALDESARKQERYNALVERYAALRANDPGNKALEGVQFGSDGKPITGGQFGADSAKIYEEPAKKSGDGEAAAKRARLEAMREEMTQLAILRDETDQASAARIAADERIVQRAKALYGENSQQYRAALNQMEADKQAQQQRLDQLEMIRMDTARTLGDMERDFKLQQAQDDYANRRITAAQLLHIEKTLIQQKLDEEAAYYERKRAMAEAAGDSVGAAQAAAAIEIATQEALISARTAEASFQAESAASWQAWGDTVSGAMQGLANNLIFQGMSWRDAFVNVLGSMLQQFIGFTGNMLSKWVSTKLAEVAANNAANAAKVTSDKLAAKESVLANAGAAIKKIVANAAEVFTSVYKAIAGIPYVGPFLAPVMAVAAGATVIGMVSKVASAERGWERVPADGMMTELHKDEQVLPAEYAEGLRSLVAQGGNGGGGGSIVIQALDAHSVKRVFENNMSEISEALGAGAGNFRFEG